MKVVSEAIVLVDHVGDHLRGLVAMDVVAAATLDEEHFPSEVEILLSLAPCRIGQRESRNRITHRPHGIYEIWSAIAVADGQLQPVPHALDLGLQVAFSEFGDDGLERR